MGSLKDRKFENYKQLHETLSEAVGEVLRYATNRAAMQGVWKQSIFEWTDVLFVLGSTLARNPKLGDRIADGFTLLMFAPENKNEEDPIINTLTIRKIEDVFWALHVVNNAFYGLLDNKED